MRLPVQSPAIARRASKATLACGIAPSGCSAFKKIACAASLIACGAVCVGSAGTACAQCLAGIGAAGCIDCV